MQKKRVRKIILILAVMFLVSCGAYAYGETGTMSLRYDDRIDVSGMTVEVLDAGTPTSYQVGYGIEENQVRDRAVITLDGDALIATGIGTATVRINGEMTQITVEAAPISLLLLIGQSNMRGSEGVAEQSIVCPDGQVYSTFGHDFVMNEDNAAQYAASALTGAYSTINVEGGTEYLSDHPIDSLTEDGNGKDGPDSGIAYEWVKQTGEKIWLVNAAHGATGISQWLEDQAQFKEAVKVFSACQETLRKEIAAGHYTLSHMGYLWCQGCSDQTIGAEEYVEKYLSIHRALKKALTFDADSNPLTKEAGLEFGGILLVRAGIEGFVSYRQGVYKDVTDKDYYETFRDLCMTGPRVAQYWMCNNPDLDDIWMVGNASEDWVWMPDGSHGVTQYFQTYYPGGVIDYMTQVPQADAWYRPTTPEDVHSWIHYTQLGFNEFGRDAARNTLIQLGEIEVPDVETKVEFLTWDGYSKADFVRASAAASSDTLVVPKVTPAWKMKEVQYALPGGVKWDYYDVLTEKDALPESGKVTAFVGDGGEETELAAFNVWPVKLSQSAVSLGKDTFTYNGEVRTPKVIVKDAAGNVLKKGVDYTVTVPAGRKAVGNYVYKVQFIGRYTGSTTRTLTIRPRGATLKQVEAAGNGGITVKWAKAKNATPTGYQVMVATDQKFTAGKKLVTVKGAAKKAVKIGKLKAKKTYYVRVRTYKTVKGVKIYSNWSKVKNVRMK